MDKEYVISKSAKKQKIEMGGSSSICHGGTRREITIWLYLLPLKVLMHGLVLKTFWEKYLNETNLETIILIRYKKLTLDQYDKN